MFEFIPHRDNAIAPFDIAALPKIRFGWGIRDQLADHVTKIAQKPLFIVSKRVFHSDFGQRFFDVWKKQGDPLFVETISGEPSPDQVDEIVRRAPQEIDWVIGIGGGSALDTAKAVAGLLPSRTSVMDYLEGVGAGKPYPGDALPWLAVPTTAGTGSETTKNAVLSRLGQFKKSFRHETLVAREAWLDPSFLPDLPKPVLHATAMDAFTQLLESYVTRKANPITDALAWQGMQLWLNALSETESADEATRQNAYGRLMLAATLSGITLSNAGLGAVHGLAGPVGAYCKAPHGMVCAALLAPITRANIEALQQTDTPEAQTTLHKYTQVGRLLAQDLTLTLSDEAALEALQTQLQSLTERYGPGSLTPYGLDDAVIEQVIATCRAGSMLGNPITLTDMQLRNSLRKAYA